MRRAKNKRLECLEVKVGLLLLFYLAIQRSVAFGVILSLLFFFVFFCTVEDISTQNGAIGVKFGSG